MMADEIVDSRISQEIVREMLEIAAFAPFHLAAASVHREKVDGETLVPWRVYVLDKTACISLRQYLLDSGDPTKVPNMLAAANTLLQVTWCPDPASADFVPDEDHRFESTIANMEHIAASSAMVQNILLAATARNIETYWSSGGALKSDPVFHHLGIPTDEILLGSVFLFPHVLSETAEQFKGVTVKPGKMREKRGVLENWCRWL